MHMNSRESTVVELDHHSSELECLNRAVDELRA